MKKSVLKFIFFTLVGLSVFGISKDFSSISFCNQVEANTFTSIYESFTSSELENGCWFCPVFESLYDTINSLASKMNSTSESGSLANAIAGSGKGLLWLLLYGYIIFKVGQMLITSAFKGLSPMEVFSEVFYPFLRCVVAAILIHSSTAIFTYLMDPVLEASIGFAKTIQDAGGTTSRVVTASISKGVSSMTCGSLSSSSTSDNKPTLGSGFRFATSKSSANVSNINWNTLSGPSSGKVFSDDVWISIKCFLTSVSQNLIMWMAVGATFIAECWGEGFLGLFPSFTMLFIGLIVFIGTFLIFLSFPMKLLDAMFRLMFVTALMPLWITFWVIPQTRGYTVKAWKMLVHIMVNFIVLSVVLIMVYGIIKSIFTKSVTGIDFDKMIDYLQDDQVSKALEGVDFSGVGIFLSAALMYLAFSLIGKAETFVGNFADGGGSLGIGKDVSGRMTQGTQLAGKVGGAAAGAVGRTVVAPVAAYVGGKALGAGKWAAGKAATPIKNWAGKVKNAYNEGKAEGETSPDQDSKAYRAGHAFGETLGAFKGDSSGSEGSRPRSSGESRPAETGTDESRPRVASESESSVNTNAQSTPAAPQVIKGEKGEKGEAGKEGKQGEQGKEGKEADETKVVEQVQKKAATSTAQTNLNTFEGQNNQQPTSQNQTTVAGKTEPASDKPQQQGTSSEQNVAQKTQQQTSEVKQEAIKTPINYFTPSKKEDKKSK